MGRGVGQHHGDLRNELISAALQLVAESDVDGITLRAVARRAGVSAAAPYHHFVDKDALLAAVARDGFDELGRVQQAVLSRPGTARHRLEELTTEYVLFAHRHRTHYGLMFRMLLVDIAGAEGQALRDAAVSAFGRLIDAVHAANPALSAEEAARRALLVWALAHGSVDVGDWGQALQPGLGIVTLAAEVGRAAGRLAVDS